MQTIAVKSIAYCFDVFLDEKTQTQLWQNQLRKGKALGKHSLREENSSLGFIETVHQW